MPLTNLLDLPEPILRACEAKLYSRGDARFSVTELLKPARQGALQRCYSESIIEDVADQLPSIFGTVVHMILALSGAPETGALLEERLYADVLGVRVSGQADHCLLYPSGRLDDFKTAMTYAVMGPLKPEWEAQTNFYAWLERQNGREITQLRIIPMLKDWTVGQARVNQTGRYPQKAVFAIEVPLWTPEEQQRRIEERVREHMAADAWVQDTANPEPFCSDEDRWKRPHKFVIVKAGNKKASPGGFVTRQDAELAANAAPKGARVEQRGGEPIRCIDYCSVGRAGLCGQWEAERATRREEDWIDTSAFD